VAQYHKILKDKITTRFGDLRKCFRVIDEDGSGSCDRVEISQMLNAMFNLNVPDRAMHRMIDLMDYDNSGDIRFDEFARVFAANDIRSMKTTTVTSADARHVEPDTTTHWSHSRQAPSTLEAIEMATPRRISMQPKKMKPITLNDGWEGPSYEGRTDQISGWRGSDLQVHMDDREEYKAGRDIDWTKYNTGGANESVFRPPMAQPVDTMEKGLPLLMTAGARESRASREPRASSRAGTTTLERPGQPPPSSGTSGSLSPRNLAGTDAFRTPIHTQHIAGAISPRNSPRNSPRRMLPAETLEWEARARDEQKRDLVAAAQLSVALLERQVLKEAFEAGKPAPKTANRTHHERMAATGTLSARARIERAAAEDPDNPYAITALTAHVSLPENDRTYSLLDLEDQTKTKTVSECVTDVQSNSPLFNSEARRLRKLGNTGLFEEQSELRGKELRRREAHARRAALYRGTEAHSKKVQEDQVDGYEEGRRHRKEAAFARMSDLQLAAESKIELEHGRETITLEPPSSRSWGSRPAPPHLVSHWSTITGTHQDPPQRQHVKMITSYQKAYPPNGPFAAAREAGDQRTPSWGGAHT